MSGTGLGGHHVGVSQAAEPIDPDEFRETFEEDSYPARLLDGEETPRDDMGRHVVEPEKGTVGYGHELDENQTQNFEDVSIPESQAQSWFQEDAQSAATAAGEMFKANGVDPDTAAPEFLQATSEMIFSAGPEEVAKMSDYWNAVKSGAPAIEAQLAIVNSDWAEKHPRKAKQAARLLIGKKVGQGAPGLGNEQRV